MIYYWSEKIHTSSNSQNGAEKSFVRMKMMEEKPRR